MTMTTSFTLTEATHVFVCPPQGYPGQPGSIGPSGPKVQTHILSLVYFGRHGGAVIRKVLPVSGWVPLTQRLSVGVGPHDPDKEQ